MSLNTLTDLTTNKYNGRTEAITIIGIHTAESPEQEGDALAVANYFKNPATDASSHWVVDDDTRVRCVNDEDAAWTMPPCNQRGLNIELAGYASQTPTQWDDEYSLLVLDNAALCVAEWCKKYDIPVRRLSDAQIALNAKGLAGHVDVDRVFHDSDHTDPGVNFPWDKFLGLVNKHLGTVTPTPAAKPNCTEFQKAIRVTADNSWGPATDKASMALMQASGDTFPYGVVFAQGVVGAKEDGQWGTVSKSDLSTTVKNAQKALTDMGFNPGGVDGNWGPNTDKAYAAARKACHI
jgi:N-acetyl-anhydromuramyl-L-alanine amidase AmpD